MFLTIALVVGGLLVVAICVLLFVAAGKPNAFRIQRAATIKAPAEKVFGLIDDFHVWPSWSPWEKLRPGDGPHAQRRGEGGRRGL
ncbi:MAG: SRPBCC family protein [Gemmataceae bacterium]